MPKYLIWLTFGAFAIGTEAYMVAGILPLMADGLHVSVALAGQFVTVFAIGYAVGSPLLTVATSGANRKSILLGSIAVFGVANLLAALAPTYGWLMGSRVLLGLSAGTFFPTAGSYAAMAVAPTRRGRALALIYTGLTVATVAGAPLGTALGERLGWRAPFFGVAFLSTVALAGIAVGLPQVPTPPAVSLRDRLKLVVRPDILSVLVLTVIALTGAFALYTYFSPLMTSIAGFEGDSIAYMLALFGVGAASGNFFGGYAADRWNVRRILRVVFALIAVDWAVLSLCGELGLPTAITRLVVGITVLLWGFISWTLPAIQQYRLVSLAGPLAPIALSLNSSAIYFGIGFGAVLGSIVIASGPVVLLGWAGVACSLLALAWLAMPLGGAVAKAVRAGTAD